MSVPDEWLAYYEQALDRGLSEDAAAQDADERFADTLATETDYAHDEGREA